ncbi:MAG: ATP-grasp domain-containing protein [Chloroflexota bacterium]
MTTDYKPTILFISSTFKGLAMMEQVHKMNCFVLLLTEEEFRDDPWNHQHIDEIFFTPDLAKYQDVIHTVSYLCRGRQIDYIVPLDEFEVELVSMLREHLQLPGMSVTASRKFRDKLTMRQLAHEAGIPVPEFVAVKNYDALRDYMERVPSPWVLKPRSEASAMGIEKVQESERLWRALDELGDKQSYYLLERFVPGDVFHVDSLVVEGEIVFVSVQKYGAPPMTIYQGGGVFNSRVIPHETGDAPELRKLNQQVVIDALGMVNGVAHTEFIKAHEDDTYYFLESAARVGGAHIAELIEYATGVNLWREWGRLVISQMRGESYTLPEVKENYGGLMMTLSKQEHPDMASYDAPEVVWRAQKAYHAGLIVVSPDYERVQELLVSYNQRFLEDFTAVAPPMGTQRTGSTD